MQKISWKFRVSIHGPWFILCREDTVVHTSMPLFCSHSTLMLLPMDMPISFILSYCVNPILSQSTHLLYVICRPMHDLLRSLPSSIHKMCPNHLSRLFLMISSNFCSDVSLPVCQLWCEQVLFLSASVCLSVQNLKNYWSATDVT